MKRPIWSSLVLVLLTLLCGVVLFASCHGAAIPTPHGWPHSLYRRVQAATDEISVFDSATGKRIFSYNPEVGYVVKEITSEGVRYRVVFERAP